MALLLIIIITQRSFWNAEGNLKKEHFEKNGT